MKKIITVERIDVQIDRVLVWGEDKNYHYIAPVKMEIKLGDNIDVESYGVNFGFVVTGN